MLRNSTSYLALAIALLLTLSSGLVHGYLDARWTGGEDLQAAAAKVVNLPEQVGPWVRVGDQKLPEAAESVLRCYGYLNREYWNPDSGDRVHVAVLFGPRGPIAVHTPEICYSSLGTEPIGSRIAETIASGGEEDELWHVQFARSGERDAFLDVWYGWSDGGAWYAGEYPRFWMTDRLYKIQLASSAVGGEGSSPCRDFLEHFLPVVRNSIGEP